MTATPSDRPVRALTAEQLGVTPDDPRWTAGCSVCDDPTHDTDECPWGDAIESMP